MQLPSRTLIVGRPRRLRHKLRPLHEEYLQDLHTEYRKDSVTAGAAPTRSTTPEWIGWEDRDFHMFIRAAD